MTRLERAFLLATNAAYLAMMPVLSWPICIMAGLKNDFRDITKESYWANLWRELR